jgi:hypothetical protein
MFITSRKSVSIPAKSGKFDIKAGFLGDVPKEVTEHWYFKALCKDGSIAFCESKNDSDIEAAKKAAAEKEAGEKAKAERNRLIDEAKASAEETTKKEAADNGLDAAATKKLIKEKQAAAVEAVLAGLGEKQ